MECQSMLVSVVTPTLNSAEWIEQCVASVMMQRTENFEVEHVIADGGSTDDTVVIAERLGCRLVDRDPSDGFTVAFNKATLMAKGDLVGFLGSDDVLLPGALLAIVRRYRDSGRRWVTGSYFWTDPDMRPTGRIAAPPEWLSAKAMATLGWCPINHQSTYMEHSMFVELGGLDPTFSVSGDYDMHLRATALGPFAREPRALSMNRRHASNLSVISPQAEAEVQRILDRHGPAGGWRRTVCRLASKAFINGRNPVWAFRKFRPLPPVR
jgi:glycosyltransferase involved in cell wall biosynthesis